MPLVITAASLSAAQVVTGDTVLVTVTVEETVLLIRDIHQVLTVAEIDALPLSSFQGDE